MANLRADTVSLLLDSLADSTASQDRDVAFEQIYAHEDYAIEIDRYSARGFESELEVSALAETLRQLVSGRFNALSSIASPHQRKVLTLISCHDAYRSRWNGFMAGWRWTLSRATEQARRYLPDSACIPDVDVLVTVGLGDSFGWPYRNVVHFDFIQMLDDFKSFTQLENLLAHELHHIGYESLLAGFNAATSAHQFLLFLAYEGMAIKFFNHPDSVFSKCLDEHMQNYQIVAADWQYYIEHWDLYFRQFQSDYRLLLKRPQTDVASVTEKWMTRERIDDSELMLTQYPNYFLGSEIIGMVMDHCGLDTVFDILFGNVGFEDIYDGILGEIGLKKFRIKE
jgi:hypothetical protein